MSTPVRVATAIAAILVVAVAVWELLPRSTGVGSPSSTPTSLPTPTPSDQASPAPIACEDDIPGCAGPLAAGAHRSVHFTPTFEFTTPKDWANLVDTETIYALTPDIPGTPDLILVWSNVVPFDQNEACSGPPRAAASLDEWITFVSEHPGLDVAGARSLSLNGSRAWVADLRPRTTWVSPCLDDRAVHNVQLLRSPETPGGYGVNDNSRLRLYAVEVGNQTAIITVYSYESGDQPFADAVQTAGPVVASFSWACKADAPPGPCWGPPDAGGNPATAPPRP